MCFLAGLLFTIYLHLLWEGKLIHQKQVVISLGYFTSKYSYMSTSLVWGRKPILQTIFHHLPYILQFFLQEINNSFHKKNPYSLKTFSCKWKKCTIDFHCLHNLEYPLIFFTTLQNELKLNTLEWQWIMR